MENGYDGSKRKRSLNKCCGRDPCHVSFQMQWQGQSSEFPKVLGKGNL